MDEKRVKRVVEWKIENVTEEKLRNLEFRQNSQQFVMTLHDNVIKWKITLTTKEVDSKLFLGCYLCKTEAVGEEFVCSYKLRIGSTSMKSTKKVKREFRGKFGWKSFARMDLVFNRFTDYLDANKAMTVVAKIELSYPDDVAEEVQLKRRKTFSQELFDEKFSDFILKSSDGKEFKVHRLVLGRCSDFFEKLLTTDMQEKTANMAVLQSVNGVILEQLIKFIYTGAIEIEVDEKAVVFLAAAEEYGLVELKSLCVGQLSKGLNRENAIELLQTADMYNAKELEIKCLKLLTNDFDYINGTVDWQALGPNLLGKFMAALANLREKIYLSTTL